MCEEEGDECDVKMWYFELLTEGTFNDLNEEQVKVKVAVEKLMAKKGSVTVPCHVLTSYEVLLFGEEEEEDTGEEERYEIEEEEGDTRKHDGEEEIADGKEEEIIYNTEDENVRDEMEDKFEEPKQEHLVDQQETTDVSADDIQSDEEEKVNTGQYEDLEEDDPQTVKISSEKEAEQHRGKHILIYTTIT